MVVLLWYANVLPGRLGHPIHLLERDLTNHTHSEPDIDDQRKTDVVVANGLLTELS